jgi:flagellar biosynthesis protein FlhB
MADHDQDQDRTEQATPKRLEEARRRGDIPRSRDLSTAAVMLTAGCGMYALGGHSGAMLYDTMRAQLSYTAQQSMYAEQMIPNLTAALGGAALALAPLFGLIVLAAVLAPLALGGWSFSGEALMPNFSRLSPSAGLKRMFSTTAVMELCKSLVKFAVVGTVAALVLHSQTDELLGLGNEPPVRAVVHALKLAGQALIAMSAALLLIAAVDVPYQLWQYAKRLKMSREEVRREHKENEGSPEMKGRIRQAQQALARRRMMQEVPKADVVVTNPTHFAVALRYDERRMRAPVVVAKGADEVAAKIREIAGQHNVPIFEAPPLARSLHRNVDIGGEIPQGLYVAVAQVLTYVFQLRAARQGRAVMPDKPIVEVAE